MKTHPIAELFPLLSDADLRDLADDIKENGLQQAVVKQGDILIDGRNRLAACELAGVEPTFCEYTGKDAAAYIVSVNLKRRHLTREQRDDVIRGLRAQGMTLEKVAKAVGVSVDTAHRATRDIELSDFGKLPGADGKSRPAHYAPREDKPHVAHATGDNEWYTPEPYAEAARSVMGKIDLDPASTPEANKVIKAERIFTADDNGLKQDWSGKLWINPPYASELVGKFIERLATSVESGAVTEALVLVNNATETKWFARLASISTLLCFPTGRVKFWHTEKDSASPLQGQAVAYIGKHGKRFAEEFKTFGMIVEIIR